MVTGSRVRVFLSGCRWQWCPVSRIPPSRTKRRLSLRAAQIDYRDPWLQIWNHFKRHLVAQHYEDLADWVGEAGFPASNVYTSQTFILADVATSVGGASANWTDQAGVSIAGAKPTKGHLGVILYGEASRNEGRPRSGLSLMENIRTTDEWWGVVEMNPAVIDKPDKVASHAESYKTLLETLNAGARFISPMWGSRLDDQKMHPAEFRSYDAMDGAPFEYQLAWWLIQLQTRPAGTLYFPFGNDLVDSLDGWSAGVATRAVSSKGEISLFGGNHLEFQSPVWGSVKAGSRLQLELQGHWPGRRIDAHLVFQSGKRASCSGMDKNSTASSMCRPVNYWSR